MKWRQCLWAPLEEQALWKMLWVVAELPLLLSVTKRTLSRDNSGKTGSQVDLQVLTIWETSPGEFHGKNIRGRMALGISCYLLPVRLSFFWRRRVKQEEHSLETIFISLCFMELGGSLETLRNRHRGPSSLKQWAKPPPSLSPSQPQKFHSHQFYTLDNHVRFHFDNRFTFQKYIRTTRLGYLESQSLLHLSRKQLA